MQEDASRQAVQYVCKSVGTRNCFRTCLFHVLTPLPPELLEHGGSEGPSKEPRFIPLLQQAVFADGLSRPRQSNYAAMNEGTGRSIHKSNVLLSYST